MANVSADIIFNKFEIIHTLKKDEHTTVYLANHIYLGKKIILKTLNTDELLDKSILDRFKREAQILAKLEHPNLIKVLDFGTYSNFFYISVEYFEGTNLKKVIHEKKISGKDKTYLVVQLLKALNIAHQNQIIHRDIKPENILVNSRLELKIADFGLALMKSENVLTQKTSIVGTPGYMSPEQIRGEMLTPQTDLFSAGIVIYELFTGVNPFLGRELNETINNILSLNVEKDLPELSSLPANIRVLIQNLLRKNFSKRLKSALEGLSLLGIEGEIYKTLPVEKGLKSSNSKKYILYTSVFIVLLSLVIGFWFKLMDNPDPVIPPPAREKSENMVKEESVGSPEENKELTNLKEEANGEKTDPPPKIMNGRIFVEVIPWAEVYIDNRKIDTTPLKSYIRLKPGKYSLKLLHPDYPPYTEEVEVQSADILNIKVDFNDYIGFLNFEIYPWGEISVDGEYIGITPFREPVSLSPGKHEITIKNPAYGEIKEEIIITAGEVSAYRLDFETVNN